MKVCWSAVFCFVLGGNAWAHDVHEHTHWWLGIAGGGVTGSAGATVTSSSFDDWSFARRVGPYTSAKWENSDEGYRVYGRLDFLKYVGLELGYADLGEVSFRGQGDGSPGGFWNAGPVAESMSTEAFDLTLTGRLDLGVDTALTARVGALQWEIEESISGSIQGFGPVNEGDSDDGIDAQYGVAAEYTGIRPLRVSLGYSRARLEASTQTHDTVTLSSFWMSLAYLFQPRPA